VDVAKQIRRLHPLHHVPQALLLHIGDGELMIILTLADYEVFKRFDPAKHFWKQVAGGEPRNSSKHSSGAIRVPV
jgi:hypothetical protein